MKTTFKNYWFKSGTPAFLVKIIKQNPEVVQELIELDTWEIAESELEAFSPEVYFTKLSTLFVQAGYLTFASYDPDSRLFNLCYPNYEVRYSMTEQIFELVGHIGMVPQGKHYAMFKRALRADDIDAFCTALKSFFTLVPHTIVVDREKFYHGAFYMICKLFGAQVDAEHATHAGFMDLLLLGANTQFVIEFKKSKSPDEALAQIKSKRYADKFTLEGNKPVMLVGISFFWDGTNIDVQWKKETAPTAHAMG